MCTPLRNEELLLILRLTGFSRDHDCHHRPSTQGSCRLMASPSFIPELHLDRVCVCVYVSCHVERDEWCVRTRICEYIQRTEVNLAYHFSEAIHL